MNEPKSLQLFYRTGLITKGIRKRLNLSPLTATVLLHLLYNTILVIAAILDNIVFSRGNRVGLFNDWGWWIITLGWGVIFYTFLWLPDGISKTILELIKNKVVKLPPSYKGEDEEEALDIFLQNFYRNYSNRLWYTITLAIAVPIWISVIKSQQDFSTWHTANLFSFWLVMSLYLLFLFLGLTVFIRIIVVTVWFNKIFKDFAVDVKVLHPDNAGGLASLSRFSLTIVYGIIIVAVTQVLGDISEAVITSKAYIDVARQSYIFAYYLIYSLFASVAFFAPLLVVHSAMKRAKNEFIAKISDQFDTEIDSIPSLLAGDNSKLKSSLSKLEELQKLHAVASKFPVWPYNTGYLARFFGAIASPILISLISMVIEGFVR